MVTAIAEMENPLEETDTVLTNDEEDEDIPFTVDEVLLRSGAPNGMEIFKKDKKFLGEVPDTRRRTKTDSFRGYQKIFIESVEELEEGEQYMTQNGNKLFKVYDDELILVSITTGKTVHIPIIIKVKSMSIVPVLLDRHAVDPTVSTTAEAVIEDLTGVTLYEGISLFEEKSERGKVIFSLKELPVNVTFKHIDSNVTIERIPSNQFKINGGIFLPAKEEQLLSGLSLLSQSSSHENSPSNSRKNSLCIPSSQYDKTGVHLSESSLDKEEEEDNEEDEFSTYMNKLESRTSLAFKRFFLDLPNYENMPENPQVEEQSQVEKKKRLSAYMNKLEQYYSSMEGTTNVAPFTSQYEDRLYSSAFIKSLQTFVNEKDNVLSSKKSQLHFSQYLEKYQQDL